MAKASLVLFSSLPDNRNSRVRLALVVGEGAGLLLAPGDELVLVFAARRGIGLIGRLAFSIGECTTNAQAVLALDPSSSELLCFRLKPKRVGESDFLYVLSFGRYWKSRTCCDVPWPEDGGGPDKWGSLNPLLLRVRGIRELNACFEETKKAKVRVCHYSVSVVLRCHVLCHHHCQWQCGTATRDTTDSTFPFNPPFSSRKAVSSMAP